MKKIGLAMVMVMGVILAACGDNGGHSTTPTTSAADARADSCEQYYAVDAVPGVADAANGDIIGRVASETQDSQLKAAIYRVSNAFLHGDPDPSSAEVDRICQH